MTSLIPASSKLRPIARLVLAVLFAKVFAEILLQYRWYFPADFDNSAFLSGRRDSFFGSYRVAFYAHLLSGPISLALGAFLMLTGGRVKYHKYHRIAGKLQVASILVVAPSGWVMAQQAYAGPVAGWGFSLLAIATSFSALATAYCAIHGNWTLHRRWASRCFILLASPLLLRIGGGATMVLQVESAGTYQASAWLTWLIPLALFEVLRHRHDDPRRLVTVVGSSSTASFSEVLP